MLRKVIFTAGLILAISFAACGGGQETTKNTVQTAQTKQKAEVVNVQPEELKKALAEGEDVIVLDVRTPEEWNQGYIDGAQNIDIYSDDFTGRVQKLDKNKTVYVYCRSGHRSMNASKKMINMGFTDVRNVEGGILLWTEKGFEVAKP